MSSERLNRHLVIKVGSALLASKRGVNRAFIARLAKEIAALRVQGIQAAVVTSGAIRCGEERLRLPPRPYRKIAEMQAAASVGQVALMQIYSRAFEREGLRAAQVLLTREDFNDRRRFNHARTTIQTLFRFGAVPVINENDSVAVEELNVRLGDNDLLSALVTYLVEAETLIILTDVKGLLSDFGRRQQALIRQVSDIRQVLHEAKGPSRGVAGGMRSKLVAAEAAAAAGVTTFIADGKQREVIQRLLRGEAEATTVFPSGRPLSLRKCWIAFCAPRRGSLGVNRGAETMLKEHGKSLLASGVTAVEGRFARGEVVAVRNEEGEEIGCGIVRFSHQQTRQIQGKKSEEIRELLGEGAGTEVIHRDDLVIRRRATGQAERGGDAP